MRAACRGPAAASSPMAARPRPDGRADPRAVDGASPSGCLRASARISASTCPSLQPRGSSSVATTRRLPARSWSVGPSQPGHRCRTSGSRRGTPSASSRASVRARDGVVRHRPPHRRPENLRRQPGQLRRARRLPPRRGPRARGSPPGASATPAELDPLPAELPAHGGARPRGARGRAASRDRAARTSMPAGGGRQGGVQHAQVGARARPPALAPASRRPRRR